jgi:type IV pilus assembly protein PilA
MQGEERRSLLMTGMSLGELLLVILLIGVILTEGMSGMQAAMRHIAQVEVFSLVAVDKVHWVETWANDGVQPAEATAPFESSARGKYLSAFAADSGDGTANFILTAETGLEGETLTFRPAFPEGSQHIVTWVCGFAPVPRGFVARGENQTTLAPADLLASCRAPIS